MTTWLLDGNVLLAICNPNSPEYQRVHAWFAANVSRFATCPITQGTLLRNFTRVMNDSRLAQAWVVLDTFLDHPMHEFWPDSIDYRSVPHAGLLGGGQVTDAYLAALARHHGGRVATFDGGFARQHPDVVTRIGAT